MQQVEDYRRAKEGEIMYDDSKSPAANASRQVGGDHYVKHTIQPWDICDEYGLDHYRATAIKYILRNKMDLYEDIEKAIHTLQHWLEINKELKSNE